MLELWKGVVSHSDSTWNSWLYSSALSDGHASCGCCWIIVPSLVQFTVTWVGRLLQEQLLFFAERSGTTTTPSLIFLTSASQQSLECRTTLQRTQIYLKLDRFLRKMALFNLCRVTLMPFNTVVVNLSSWKLWILCGFINNVISCRQIHGDGKCCNRADSFGTS